MSKSIVQKKSTLFQQDLHKNENARRKEMNKLENDHESGGGFKPREFKSSRTKPNASTEKISTEQMHENAIFGTNVMPFNKILDKSETYLSKTINTDKVIMSEHVSL